MHVNSCDPDCGGKRRRQPSGTGAALPGCRRVDEVVQSDSRTLAIASSDGQRYRLDLASECRDLTKAATSKIVAEGGWVCGRGNEFIIADNQRCEVATIHQITPAGYAAMARASYTSADGTVTLPGISVKGEERRRFVASVNYCINPRHVRGWSEDGDGLVVEVNPRRAGGNRFYRVELASNCPQLSGGSAMQLQSGMGIGVVCGNPGDRLVAGTRSTSGGALSSGSAPMSFRDGRPEDFLETGTDQLQLIGSKFGCPIRAVYPHILQ